MATLAIFCSTRGYKKRLLGSLPKPSSAQAPHLSQPAKADFSLALLRLLSPPNPLALGFDRGPDVIVCGPRALTLGQIVPKRKADGAAQPSLGASDVERVSSKISK